MITSFLPLDEVWGVTFPGNDEAALRDGWKLQPVCLFSEMYEFREIHFPASFTYECVHVYECKRLCWKVK